MPTLDYNAEADKLILWCSPRDREKLKAIPGASYDHRTSSTAGVSVWNLRPSWGTALALRSTFGEELHLAEGAIQWGEKQRDWIEQVQYAKALDHPIDFMPFPLRPWQPQAARFLWSARAAILADEMRVGKTVETLTAVAGASQAYKNGLGPNPWPVLIVATNSMTYGWVDEIHKWYPDAQVEVAVGSAAKRKAAIAAVTDEYHGTDGWPAFLVIGWPNVWRHSRIEHYPSVNSTPAELEPKELDAAGFNTVVVDEAHRMLGHRSKQTRAIWNLMHKAEFRWALTGTPITGKPEALWSIMHGLAPDEYPARTRFIERYVRSWKNYFGGLETAGFQSETQAEFYAFFDNRFFRRTQAETIGNEPPSYTQRVVEMTPKQAKAYAEMKKHLMTRLDDGSLVTASNPLAQMGKLQQYAAYSPQPEGAEPDDIAGLASCKIDALDDLLDELGDLPFVVFVQNRVLHHLVAKHLEKRKVLFGKVTGDESDYEKNQAVVDFQGGRTQVIVASLGAGSESITLNRASTVVFLQRSWKLSENLQAEARIVGERRGTTVIDVLTKGTVEDDVHVAQAVKEGNLQAVVRDPDWIAKVLR